MSLDKKILERIENEKLEIRPKWFFAVKDIIFGTGTFFLSIFGSLSLALLFEIIKQQGKNLTWLSIPYAWVILLGVFLVAGYWLVTKIDSLYKMRFVPIVLMLFFVNLSFGYLTFASGKAEKIEFELEKIPIYDVIMPIKRDISVDAVKKTEADNGNTDVKDKNEKNDDDTKEDSKSTDSDENDNDNIRESNSKVEIKEENEDDEIEKSEKTGSINKDEDNLDDSVSSKAQGVSKEINEDEDEDEDEEIEEIGEEKSDSDDEIASLSENSSEKSESDNSSDAVDED